MIDKLNLRLINVSVNDFCWISLVLFSKNIEAFLILVVYNFKKKTEIIYFLQIFTLYLKENLQYKINIVATQKINNIWYRCDIELWGNSILRQFFLGKQIMKKTKTYPISNHQLWLYMFSFGCFKVFKRHAKSLSIIILFAFLNILTFIGFRRFINRWTRYAVITAVEKTLLNDHSSIIKFWTFLTYKISLGLVH